jgi:hypothetical protein
MNTLKPKCLRSALYARNPVSISIQDRLDTVAITEWKQLHKAARPSLKSLLLSEIGKTELDLPQRGLAKCRTLPDM